MSIKNNKRPLCIHFVKPARLPEGSSESNGEFLEYSCPGVYHLPKNPDQVWQDGWRGWDDWLGVCYSFEEGRIIARGLKIKTKEEILKRFVDKESEEYDPASRLPYRPDWTYKEEWTGWDDWLGC